MQNVVATLHDEIKGLRGKAPAEAPATFKEPPAVKPAPRVPKANTGQVNQLQIQHLQFPGPEPTPLQSCVPPPPRTQPSTQQIFVPPPPPTPPPTHTQVLPLARPVPAMAARNMWQGAHTDPLGNHFTYSMWDRPAGSVYGPIPTYWSDEAIRRSWHLRFHPPIGWSPTNVAFVPWGKGILQTTANRPLRTFDDALEAVKNRFHGVRGNSPVLGPDVQ